MGIWLILTGVRRRLSIFLAFSSVTLNHLVNHRSQATGEELRGEMYRKVRMPTFESINRLKPAVGRSVIWIQSCCRRAATSPK